MSEPVDRAAALLGHRARRDVPIGPLTTYRVGGPAALFMTVASDDDLADLGAAVAASGVAVLVVGKGSNLLVADAGFDGLAVALGEAFEGITIERTTVTAGAAAFLPVVARRSAAAALTGFEWAVGVPGSIGGAVRMNAGGHGSDMAATLTRVRVADLENGDDGWMAASALALGYRSSSIARAHVVIAAELALAVGDRERSEAEIAEIVRWRRENQPGGQNAGSVFTNPPGDSAGRLIDEAGCKGLRVGSAVVSDKHANFFIADPGGRADDVHTLMNVVRERVHHARGVWLEPETRLVGFAANPGVEVEG
ncbi:MAG: UDP-N-acetylmuramate dehydrogenase [Acidimicrobiaceae bacterium]|jgi:UDP-N-acetylmuramate dehydrogenase